MANKYRKEDIEKFKRTWLGKKLISWGVEFRDPYERYKRPKESFSGSGIFRDENGLKRLGGNSIYEYWRDQPSGVLFTLLFAIFWNGITGTIMYAMFNGGPIKVNNQPFENIYVAFEHHPWILVFLIFPIIGVSFIYFALTSIVNKTRYTVDNHSISVKHGPLPAFGNKNISRADIRQLYVVQRIYKGKNQTHLKYKLMMLSNRSDKPIELAGPFSSYKNARILEQWFEMKLGISDEFVKGEVG